MRIITGKAKGIVLKTLAGTNTRPTAERVKEAVFSMIQFDVEGRSVLDLFAGSGQMGLEALSRGASSATFVDKARDAIAIVKENATKSKLLDSAEIIQAEYLDFIRRSAGKQYDIIFLDPPYALNMYAPALKALADNNMLKPSSLIVCESDKADLLAGHDDIAEKFTTEKCNKYGNTYIAILKINN